MTTKGSMDLLKADDEHAFKLVKECLSRCERDAINLKSEEYIAINNLLDDIEKRLVGYKKKAGLWDLVKSSLTAKQNMKVIEEKLE